MSIRRKLTYLLLFVALIPLVVSGAISVYGSWVSGKNVADRMRKVLASDAENSLRTITRDFSRLLDAREKNFEIIARLQAQKIEKRIADAMLAKEGHKVINRPIKATSSAAGAIPFSENKTLEELSTEEKLDSTFLPAYGSDNFRSSKLWELDHPIQEVPLPGSSDIWTVENFGFDESLGEKFDASKKSLSDRYVCIDPFSGKHLSSFDVSYDKQRCYTVGKGDSDRRFELYGLGSMTASYFLIDQMANGVILWQYTILESGIITSYPFSNVRTIKEISQLRAEDIYQRVKTDQKIFFSPPMIDEATGETVISIVVPLLYPDGNFAGMTGLDVVTKRIFNELELPGAWKEDATAMLIKRLGPYSKRPGDIAVLAKKIPKGNSPKEIQVVEPEKAGIAGRSILLPSLKASDPKLLEEIVDRAVAGELGIVQMKFDGKESMWAFGPAHEGQEANEPFLIVIVPIKNVLSQAEKEEKDIIDIALRELSVTGTLFIVMATIAAVIGFRSAKEVTQPIGQIADAGVRLSSGDYHAHVEIETGDELQRLGEVFNETGPKLLEREKMLRSLTMAMEVQQQLLPQAPPVCEGLEVTGGSIYCDETGGDYFDYLTLSNVEGDAKRLGVAIGDVSGHGIGAALIMASIRSVLRSHAQRLQDRLEELMGLLNQNLTEETDTGRFVTLCFSVFDPKQRTLRWVSAGHDPALHLHRDPATGKIAIDELPNSGLPLGVIEDADYEAMGPLSLEVGDLVVFGTDGAWETTDPSDKKFGKERLFQLLRTMYDQPVETLRQSILEAVDTFRGDGPQLDDITLVVVRVV